MGSKESTVSPGYIGNLSLRFIKDLDGVVIPGGVVGGEIEKAGLGLWKSSEGLLEFAGKIRQTIEGKFFAFPKQINSEKLGPMDLSLWDFPRSQAELAVVAIDSSYFEIFAKDPEIVWILRQSFQDVRDEDPANYFSAWEG